MRGDRAEPDPGGAGSQGEDRHESLFSRLPGRLGAGARDYLAKAQHHARIDVNGARQSEEKMLARYEVAETHFVAATQTAKRLEELRESQTRREHWIEEHSEELRWERELRIRLHDREQQLDNDRDRGELSDGLDGAHPSRTARARDAGGKARAAEQEETVVGWRRGADHTAAPEPPNPSPDHGGPVLRL